MQLTYISFRTVIVETVSTKHGPVEVRTPTMSKPLVGAAARRLLPSQASELGSGSSIGCIYIYPIYRPPGLLLGSCPGGSWPSCVRCTFGDRVAHRQDPARTLRVRVESPCGQTLFFGVAPCRLRPVFAACCQAIAGLWKFLGELDDGTGTGDAAS